MPVTQSLSISNATTATTSSGVPVRPAGAPAVSEYSFAHRLGHRSPPRGLDHSRAHHVHPKRRQPDGRRAYSRVQPAVHGREPGGSGQRCRSASRADESDRSIGRQPGKRRLQNGQASDQLPGHRCSNVFHPHVPECATSPAGAEGRHQVVDGQDLAAEEGVHSVTVGGVCHDRPHTASQTARRGREPSRISRTPPGTIDRREPFTQAQIVHSGAAHKDRVCDAGCAQNGGSRVSRDRGPVTVGDETPVPGT